MSPQNEKFPQFEDSALPCQSCGTLVRITSSDLPELLMFWADGLVNIFCHGCFPKPERAIPEAAT